MSLNEGGTEMVDGNLCARAFPEKSCSAQPLRSICPYSFEAGRVQAHVKDFAEEMISRRHSVSVLAPRPPH